MRSFFLTFLLTFFAQFTSPFFFGANESEDQRLNVPGNCECTCDCQDAPEEDCDLDLYILLDAAVCVRETWDEMKFRVNLLAKSIDEEYPIGSQVRISIISYAKSVVHNIKIDATNDNGNFLNYYELSEKIDKLDWMNEGSYLNNGVEFLRQVIKNDIANDDPNHLRQKAALLVTNGKSHKTVADDVVAEVLIGLRDEDEVQLFFNTLVPIQDEKTYEDCKVCDFNRKLIENLLEMTIRTDANLDRELVMGSVISKTKLVKYFSKELLYMCPHRIDPGYCTDCACTCEMPEGLEGLQGPPGLPGPMGRSSMSARMGLPGQPGRCGVNGPEGISGLNGRDGSPGAHGSPAGEGLNGFSGLVGAEGNQGRRGRPGSSGSLGQAGEEGPAGLPGDDGELGPRGDDGEKGLKGPSGNPGPVGDVGDKGDKGDQGPDGPDGRVGPRGAAGKRGRRGAPGEHGDRGPAGQRGPQGYPGVQGQQGLPGNNGKDGPVGARGIRGNPGPTGKPGALQDLPPEKMVRERIRGVLQKMLPEFGSEAGSLAMFTGGLARSGSTEKCYPNPSAIYTQILNSFKGSVGNIWKEENVIEVESVDDEFEGGSIFDNYEGLGLENEDENDIPVVDPTTKTIEVTRPTQSEADTQIVPGIKQADILFLIEASENMISMNWQSVINWIKILVEDARENTDYTSVDSMAIVIRFRRYESQAIQRLLNLKKQELSQETGMQVYLEYLTESTNDSYQALELIMDKYYPRLRIGSKKFLVTLTDGFYRTSSERSVEEKQAILDECQSKFDAMIAIGYGEVATNDDLKLISKGDSYYLLDSVRDLVSVTEVVTSAMNLD